jgi:hypothetical protein
LQEKSQTQDTLKGFLRRAQNEFGLRIKKIRSDNGMEFKNSQIEGFLEDEGVGVLGPTAHPELPLKVLLGVGQCYRL